MGSYSGSGDKAQRAKAIALTIAANAALGAAILLGLNVEVVKRAVDNMKTIAISEAPPPEPVVELPKPQPKPEKAKLEEGAAGKKADPTPVVAPPAPVPTPITAAKVAGTGSSADSGAAESGSGTGAGGSGSGRGGGGMGDTSGFTPARLVRNLGRGDYRAIAGGRLSNGTADMAISVAATGAVDGCQVVRSSGDAGVDAALCPLVTRKLRFDPARDAGGRAIGYRTNYRARWTL